MEGVDRKYKNGGFVESPRYRTIQEWENYRDIPDWKREILVILCVFILQHNVKLCPKLIANVNHVIKNDIPGDFVETGVFMGGSCMIIAEVLKQLKVNDRAIWMYDTYEGVPKSQ